MLVSSTPADGAEDVRTDLTGITAMFNVELATATITLRDDPTSDPVVPAADTVIDASNAQVARLPLGTTGLEPSTTYTATIAVTASGDRSASFTVRFTTRAADTAPSLRIAPQIVEVGEPITAFGTGFQPGVQVGFELRDDFPAGTFRSDEVVEVFSDGVGVVDDTGLGAGQRDAPGSFDDIGGATSISLGTTTVETDGTFLTDLATTTLPTGEFVITAEELSGARRSASSEVLIRLADAPLPTPDTDGDGDAVAESLPRTGPWGVPLLSLLGGLLAVAGTGMLLASRRTAPSGAGDRSMFTAGSPPA